MNTRRLVHSFFVASKYFLLMHMKVLISIQCVEKLNQLHIHEQQHHSIQRATMNRQVCTHYNNDVGHNERARFCVDSTTKLVYSYKRKHTSRKKEKKRRRRSKNKRERNSESSDDLAFKSIYISHGYDNNYSSFTFAQPETKISLRQLQIERMENKHSSRTGLVNRC